ncbi:MAG: EF-P lysine aminoacylase GenX, partial [Rhizobiales bacterium]|nr:EF-P lysine aminoacylase GenX [Hyphomicrobiales bacterium]
MKLADLPSPWWNRNRHQDRRPFLAARGAITAACRTWFTAAGFVEVETGVLQVSPGNETQLHAPRTALIGAEGENQPRYLRTSPEFACKKLLAAGETRIVEFARVFRDRERGDLHLPEFTMLEWYRADEPYEAVIADCLALIALAADTAQTRAFSFRGRSADPFARAEGVTVAEAFRCSAGIDLLATIDGGEGYRDAFA